MTRNLLPTVKDSAASPETLVRGEAEWLRGVLWENMKFTTRQNSRVANAEWKGCRCDQWGSGAAHSAEQRYFGILRFTARVAGIWVVTRTLGYCLLGSCSKLLQFSS